MVYMEELENKFIMYISAYEGIEHLEEYSLNAYIKEELKEYILEYKTLNNIKLDFKKCYEKIEKKNDLLVMYQDALYVINELNGPIELIHLLESKIKNFK